MSAEDQVTNLQDLIQLAINAARSGNTDGARVMLRQVIQRDRRNEQALLWLAKIARDKQEREDWLNKVLDANPDNLTAKKQLEKMQYNREASNNRMLMFYGFVTALMLILVIVVVLVVAL